MLTRYARLLSCSPLYIQEIPVIISDGYDHLTDMFRKTTGFIINIVNSHAAVKTNQEAVFSRKEALIFRIVKIFTAPEGSEFVLIGAALRIRTEDSAITTFITHAVNVNDLLLAQAWDLNGNVCAVRAHLNAGFTHRRT